MRHGKREILVKKEDSLNDVGTKPVLSDIAQNRSGVIRIYLKDESKEYVVGFYCYTFNCYMAFKSTAANKNGKTKITENLIKGWLYV